MRRSLQLVLTFISLSIFGFAINLYGQSSEQFEYEHVLRLLSDRNPVSIEAFLESLPIEFRSKFVLVHHSQSQNPATPEEPRIIFVNENATLLVAVNGTQSGIRNESLEIIRFDKSTNSFIPAEIDFSDKTSGHFKIKDNPAICYSCHGETSFHPIWRAYDTWPGVYGSFHAQSIPGIQLYPLKKVERDMYRNFISGVAASSRFRILPSIPKSPEILKVRNSDLTNQIAKLNALRLKSAIENFLARRPELRDAALAALVGHPSFVAFLPARENQPEHFAKVKELIRRTRVELTREFEEKKLLAKKFGSTPTTLNFERDARLQSSAMTRYFLETFMGESLRTYTTTLKDRYLEFSTPNGNFFGQVASLLMAPHIRAYAPKLDMSEKGIAQVESAGEVDDRVMGILVGRLGRGFNLKPYTIKDGFLEQQLPNSWCDRLLYRNDFEKY